MQNRMLVASLAAALCTAPARAQDTTAAFDITSWTLPAGFAILAGGRDHINFRRVDPALASLGPLAFAGLALALFAVALVASLVPALGALRIAPMTVLRQE